MPSNCSFFIFLFLNLFKQVGKSLSTIYRVMYDFSSVAYLTFISCFIVMVLKIVYSITDKNLSCLEHQIEQNF